MSFKMPKITVITPSYQQGDFIEETILSVVHQRYPLVEHFVFDGGSTDTTRDVLVRNSHHLAYWEIEIDRGQSHAVNKGLERVTGDFVLILNSDDVVLPGAFHYLAAELEKSPSIKWLAGASLMFGDQLPHFDLMPVTFPTTVELCLVDQCVPHPSTYVHADMYRKFGPYDEEMGFALDFEYWARMAMAGEVLHARQRPLSGFRYHAESKSVTLQERRRKDQATILDRYRAQLTPKQISNIKFHQDELEISNELYKLVYLALDGHVEKAKSEWHKITKLNPQSKKYRAFYSTYYRIFFKSR